MILKSLVIKFIPKKLLKFMQERRQNNYFIYCYKYDKTKYLSYSATLKIDSKEKLLGRISATTHVIEKGLTMPELRLGFGQDRIRNLVDYLKIYDTNKYEKNDIYIHAIQVLLEYVQLHENNNYTLNCNYLDEVKFFVKENIKPSEQLTINYDEYFKKTEESFYLFSNSRHSVRNLKQGLDLDLINKAIDLAANVPTACNRQPQRIHVLSDKKLIADVLSIQDGNRGFGHLCDKLIFITVDLSTYRGIQERNYPFVDGGIYLMNLLYALHYYKVGACTLNWCYTPESDKAIRKVLSLKDSEVGIAFVMCGEVSKDDVKIAMSRRNPPIVYYDK